MGRAAAEGVRRGFAVCAGLLLGACDAGPPFEAHAAAPGPASPTAPPSPRPAIATAPVAQAALPPLPFRYIGSWTQAGRTTAMLQRGDALVTVFRPGPLDAQYRVVAIDGERVLIEDQALRLVRRLSLQMAPLPPPSPTVASPAVTNSGALAIVVTGSEHPDN